MGFTQEPWLMAAQTAGVGRRLWRVFAAGAERGVQSVERARRV